MNYNINWIKFSPSADNPTDPDDPSDPGNPDSPGGTAVEISNPGFESGDLTGWTEWHPSGQSPKYGIDGNDVHGGGKKLWLWSSGPYQQSVHQVKSGLSNGSYTVQAWMKQSSGAPLVSRMEVAGYGGDLVYVNASHGSEYQLYTATVNVTSGKLDIGFYIQSNSADANLQIDDVVLMKN
ncbi:carbohydrate binding domain-containing protein [Paenibacillus hexagrammi]|uniref:CBM-cenC domain-containing protein n=1 Tax=Paenibacillus hexagrammi TaxID=2908839 RepID=A0ABY3SFW8_9BACL|nr:hypothetical protein [Paenibacillus sp. YPD9-1]UJF31827.1 hypothetical protein L0M14_18920 [Paenibacillus sp. YPD9-1]